MNASELDHRLFSCFDPARLKSFLLVLAVLLAGQHVASAATKTWNGGTSTDWNTAANWSPSGIPATGDDVVCTNGNARYPILNASANNAVRSLAINSGSSVTLNSGGSLTVSGGNSSISGAVTNTGGTLSFANTTTVNSGGTMVLSGGTNLLSAALSISAGGTLVVSGSGLLHMAANTATVPTDNITLNGALSQSGGTIALHDISGNGTTTISGGLIKVSHDFKLTTFSAAGGTVQFIASNAGGTFPVGTYQFFNVLIDSGVVEEFDNAAVTIRISGNYTNNGTASFINKVTTVEFNGSAAQAIGGSSSTTFDNLTVTNAAGVTLYGVDATITDTLALPKGVLTTRTNIAVIASGAVVSRTGPAPGFVEGNLQKVVNRAVGTVVTYEVGTGSSYTPLTIAITTIATTTGSITGSSTGSDHPSLGTSGINTVRSVNRYWSLSLPTTGAFAIGSGQYSITNNFVSGDLDPGTDTSTLVMRRFTSPSTWSSTTIGSRSSTNISATALTAFGDFAVGNLTGGATATSLAASAGTSCAGQTLVFTASITNNGAPAGDGTVNFIEGGTCASPATVLATSSVNSNGQATFSTTTLSAGSHTVTACYTSSNFASSSASTVVSITVSPTGPSPGISSNLAPSVSMKIRLTSILAAWTDSGAGSNSVTAAGPSSSQGGTVSKDSTYLYYVPPAASFSTDSIPYVVSGTNGCSTAGSVNVLIVKPGGLVQTISTSGGAVTVGFAGIPGYQYDIERSTNLPFSNPTLLLTTSAPPAGVFSYTDNAPPQPTAYYRLKQH